MDVDKGEKHILLFRFSAIGDIAIAAPLVRAYAKANPDILFTMVSQPMMRALYTDIANLGFVPADFKGKHKGFKGLLKLFRELSKLKPSHLADLHNVLRTWVLRTLFAFSLTGIAFLHKGRAQKRELTRKKGKNLRQLPSMVRRYESVLVKIGLKDLHFSETSLVNHSVVKDLEMELSNNEQIKIGIAPFAKHRGKAWPIEYMEEVVAELSGDLRFKILLFGGGWKEISQLQAWEQKYSAVESVAGKHTLAKELEIINKLDFMISMDSANMHLASFTGTRVVSIWGATHPFVGFYGCGQSGDDAIQLDMSCRPCSVFGNKECFRGDYACMINIEPRIVLDKIYAIINKTQE